MHDHIELNKQFINIFILFSNITFYTIHLFLNTSSFYRGTPVPIKFHQEEMM